MTAKVALVTGAVLFEGVVGTLVARQGGPAAVHVEGLEGGALHASTDVAAGKMKAPEIYKWNA